MTAQVFHSRRDLLVVVGIVVALLTLLYVSGAWAAFYVIYGPRWYS